MPHALLRRTAITRLAVFTLIGAASCSSDSSSKADSEVKSDATTADSDLHNAVTRAYDDTTSALENGADDFGAGSQDVYDRATADLESLGADLDDAGSETGKDADAYDDVQHRLEDMSHDIDTHLDEAGDDLGDAELDAWNHVQGRR